MCYGKKVLMIINIGFIARADKITPYVRNLRGK